MWLLVGANGGNGARLGSDKWETDGGGDRGKWIVAGGGEQIKWDWGMRLGK